MSGVTYREAKIHRMPDVCMSFSAKKIINGSLAEKDLQLKASYAFSPPCRNESCHISKRCVTY